MLKFTKTPDKARWGKTKQEKTRRGGTQTRRYILVLKNYTIVCRVATLNEATFAFTTEGSTGVE